MTSQSEKLSAEIQEMEAAMFPGQGNEDTSQEPEVNTQADSVEDVDDEMELGEAGDADIITSDTNQAPTKQKRVSWKKRFNGLNSVHAAFKHSSAQQMADLQAELERYKAEVFTLKAQVTELTAHKDSFTEAFSSEDIEVLGEETVNSLKKATQNVVEPLQRQLEQEKAWRIEQQARSVQANQAQAQQSFLDRLGDIVPDYLEVDSSPQFINWMKEVDPVSGYTREVLFKQAEKSGDVGRVANFMIEFKNVLNPLDSKITPTTASRSITTTNQVRADKPMTWQEIDKYYDDVSKGKYRGKEKLKQEIEAKIDAQAFA